MRSNGSKVHSRRLLFRAVADEQFVGFNPSAPPGQRLAPEIRTEIAILAPSAVTDLSLTEQKYKDGSVTRVKIAPDSIDDTLIADDAVKREHLAPNAVGTNEVENNSITPPKVGTGVLTIRDHAGAALSVIAEVLTTAEYSGITPTPNVLYIMLP